MHTRERYLPRRTIPTRTHTLLRPIHHDLLLLLRGRAVTIMMDLNPIQTSTWRSRPASQPPVSQFSVMKMASHTWNWEVPLHILTHTPVTVAIIRRHPLITLRNLTIKPTPVLAPMANQIPITIPDKVIAQIPMPIQVVKTMLILRERMDAVTVMVQIPILMVMHEVLCHLLVGLHDVCHHTVTQQEGLQDLPVITNKGCQCSMFPCTN